MIFRKTHRLLKRRQFKKIGREGKRLVGSLLCIDCLKGATLKLGITAPGKYGSSPERNRFKRLVREVFRLNQFTLPPCIEINVSPRKLAKKASFSEIENEMRGMLNPIMQPKTARLDFTKASMATPDVIQKKA